MIRYLEMIVFPSLPDLIWQSSILVKKMDARVEPGHDGREQEIRADC
jgi:hypothetical protein